MLSFVSTDRSRDASGNISDETDRLHGIISREISSISEGMEFISVLMSAHASSTKPSNGSLCNKKSNMRRNI